MEPALALPLLLLVSTGRRLLETECPRRRPEDCSASSVIVGIGAFLRAAGSPSPAPSRRCGGTVGSGIVGDAARDSGIESIISTECRGCSSAIVCFFGNDPREG